MRNEQELFKEIYVSDNVEISLMIFYLIICMFSSIVSLHIPRSTFSHPVELSERNVISSSSPGIGGWERGGFVIKINNQVYVLLPHKGVFCGVVNENMWAMENIKKLKEKSRECKKLWKNIQLESASLPLFSLGISSSEQSFLLIFILDDDFHVSPDFKLASTNYEFSW